MPDIRLLYVEDDDTNIFVMERLMKNDLLITSVDSAAKCIETANNNDFDIILMDINLGNGSMDGVQLMNILKKEKGIKIPIIALTSYSHHHERTGFIELGFDRHVTKPIEKALLLSEIHKILGK